MGAVYEHGAISREIVFLFGTFNASHQWLIERLASVAVFIVHIVLFYTKFKISYFFVSKSAL